MEIIELILTILSMAGAVFAWYQANISKSAKNDAEEAKERAIEQLKLAHAEVDAARAQAKEAKKIAESLEHQLAVAKAHSRWLLAMLSQLRNQLAVLLSNYLKSVRSLIPFRDRCFL